MGKGKLKFKGDRDSKKKKKKSKHSKTDHAIQKSAAAEQLAPSSASVGQYSTSSQPTSRIQKDPVSEGPVIQTGKGSIMSSGTVLMGQDTKFKSTLNAGDAILVHIPTQNKDGTETLQEEMRVITMALSDTSASISSAFSVDLKTPTSFQFIAKPRNQQKERMERDKKAKMSKEEMERSAFGTYRSSGKDGKEFVYRERTVNGGYRIRREIVEEDTSRGDLLSMRTQKKVRVCRALRV